MLIQETRFLEQCVNELSWIHPWVTSYINASRYGIFQTSCLASDLHGDSRTNTQTKRDNRVYLLSHR